MRILITGSSGFVGRSVLKKVESNLDKKNVTLLSSHVNSLYSTCVYHKDMNGYHWDLPNDFDVLVHIGAWTPKSSNESQDFSCSFDNILFTKTLLQSLPNVKRIVFISTLDVYAPTNDVISEKSLVSPISLYGFSKLYCEEMVKAWSEQNHMDCCILRLGHIYGIGEEAYRKVIPVLIKQALKNETINITTSGEELRSFLNIEDCANIICQATLGSMCGLYNVVSSKAVSVKEIAFMIKKLSSSMSEIVIHNRNIATRDCVFDNSHLRDAFQLEDEIDLARGLKGEIDYFKTILQ